MTSLTKFMMIYNTISKDETCKKVQEYRKERYQKALKQAQGDKRKAYGLLASEDFY
ncbi:MAG: hypothetical protein ACE5FT_04815 [Candidatus Nanoarchaeia archaeon]